jgi:putative addiction module component (TIGR02574 family)
MPAIDFSHLSRQERIKLIGDLCESLDGAAPPLTTAQQTELDRRVASLDADLTMARDADQVLAELADRYR